MLSACRGIYLMPVDSEIIVADARQAFLRWNKSQYNRLIEALSSLSEKDTYKYIQLIPLFLQLNNKLLPGYTGHDVPLGIFGYKPDKTVIYEAKLLHSKFRYQQEGVIKNYAIESVFFQQQLVEKKHLCWIYYRADLDKKKLLLLREKINKLSIWFSSRGLEIEFISVSVNEFKKNKPLSRSQKNLSLFLDAFYSESILLAGKYPVWWLVSPSRETKYTESIEHIKQARFVDNEEYIDLGDTADYVLADIVQDAVEQVQKIKQAPEICLVNVLLSDQKASLFPAFEGIACRLKRKLYEGGADISPVSIVAEIMQDAFRRYADKTHILAPDRLFLHLKDVPGKLNIEIVNAFLGDESSQYSSMSPPSNGIDKIITYLNFFKAVAYEVQQIFSNIVVAYHAQKNTTETDQSLTSVTHNMLDFLSENAGRVPLYNNKDNIEIVLERIQLKHEVVNRSEGLWSLVLEISEGNERTIEGFSSLLGLLSWCWLNRIVNHSTQVSIDCPSRQVKQTEAYYVLEILIQRLNPKLISNIPAEAFENPVRPLQSLIFLNSIADEDNALHLIDNDIYAFPMQCEQLIINSWGDVYTKKYSGFSGVLQCLCEWTHSAPLNGMAKPQQLMVFSYGSGDSTYLSQRVMQIYEEILSFFYYAKNNNGRLVVRIDDSFHLLYVEDDLLVSSEIGRKKYFLEFLELPIKTFQPTGLERLAFTEYPFHEIYQNNKKNVFQVFFQVINRSCYSWVLDENGTLWTDVITVYERDVYIMHWLYFFKNIRQRLKKINHQDRELPTLEINQISFNQLGGIEFYSFGADAVSSEKHFLDIQVKIISHENGDQLSLVCDAKRFDYQELKQNVLAECVQYLSARMMGEGRKSVFVTDIDVPLRLFNVADRNDIQISHILKFKRNFEHRINKMLDG